MDTALKDIAAILQRSHPAYSFGSDRIANAEGFIWHLTKFFPEKAKPWPKEFVKILRPQVSCAGCLPIGADGLQRRLNLLLRSLVVRNNE